MTIPLHSSNASLLTAAQYGNLLALQQALAQGADPNVSDMTQATALHWTAIIGHTPCLALLLPLSNPNQQDFDGNSALHYAAAFGSQDCVTLLLPHSDLHQLNNLGQTPLAMAQASGKLDSVVLIESFLLEHTLQPSLMGLNSRRL